MTYRTEPTGSADYDANGAGEAEFKPLTKQEAEALRARHPPLSPWRVVTAQAVAGVVCAALVWGLTGKGGVVWSVLYGAAAIVVPSALLAGGIRSFPATNPGTAVFGFLLW